MEYGSYYKGKNVLITGGLGFIGSNLAIALTEMGSRVIIMDNNLEGHGGNAYNIAPIQDRVELHITDLRNGDMTMALVKGMDIIFHLAAHTHSLASQNRPFVDLDINCVGTLILLQSCRRNNPGVRVVYGGSRLNPYWLREGSSFGRSGMELPDLTQIHKMAGELYHRVFHHQGIIAYTALRLGNLYGPRASIHRESAGFLNWLIYQAIHEKEMDLPKDEGMELDYVYIRDIVDAFVIAGANESAIGKTYDIHGQDRRSPFELAGQVADALGKKPITPGEHIADKEEIPQGASFHEEQLFSVDTGWKPRVDLIEGIRETATFYENHKREYWKGALE